MPAYLQNLLYYTAIVVLLGGGIVGMTLALRARREAREGVDITSEAEMLSEFERARDAGEMDDAEFRRVRDLLIAGKGSQGREPRTIGPEMGLEELPPASAPPQHPKPTDSE